MELVESIEVERLEKLEIDRVHMKLLTIIEQAEE